MTEKEKKKTKADISMPVFILSLIQTLMIAISISMDTTDMVKGSSKQEI